MTDVLTRDQIGKLERAGLSKEQINIVVHNLDKYISTKKITRESVEIVVHNLVSNQSFKRDFFANPLVALDKLFNI